MRITALIAALFLGAIYPVFSHAQRELPDFTELVDKQGAAVVNVSTTQVVRNNRAAPQMPPGIDEDDPMFEFFKRFIPRQPGMPRDQENRSLGSGFVISADGFILTNAHVVDAADEVVVKLTDKREFKAKVVGADKRTDVALLKIEATGLQTVKLGEPSKLKVGEWVVAIGSPFGFDSTVTAGIVSAKGRSLPQENFVPFIQTDVAINPGNSGGPLFNLRGEVVGINSQIYSRTGGYMGLAFAIPIDVAMDVQNQLRTSGKVQRGRIGVVIQEVTKDLAESFGMGKPEGALVSSIEPSGPAEKAGVEPGDVIVRFDGKPVSQSSDLPRLVGGTRAGSTVKMQVWRKGALRELTVTVGEMPDEIQASRSARRGKAAPQANRLGLVLSELGAEQRKQLKVEGGLLVDDVSGAGGRTELRPGDVILATMVRGQQTDMKTVDQFNAVLSKLERNAALTLLVRRGEMQTYVTVRPVAEGALAK